MSDEAPGPLSRLLARLGPGDRAVYGLVLALALVALAGRPLLAWNDVRLPVTEAYRTAPRGTTPTDPWGEPFQPLSLEWRGNSPWVARSAGPNGVFDDEDDVLVRARQPGPPGAYELYRALAVWPWFLAALLAGGWELWRFLSRPRHPDLRVELAYGLGVSLPLGLGLAWLVHTALRWVEPLRELRDEVAPALFVPFDVALVASCCGLVCLCVVGLRAQRPQADEQGS